jgi:phosphatidylglycerol---prolipoprotein diacylglyceryl transferase
MPRLLLHLYGPIGIYSYGLCIACAAFISVHAFTHDPRFKTLKLESIFSSLFLIGTLSILVGGRILHLLTVHEDTVHLIDVISFWEPGFSVLGSLITVLICVPLFLYWQRIPVLPCIDLIATYAGLLQGISRLGCFFAGCCFGCPSKVGWAVSYTDPTSIAPLYISLHPVQLYSAMLLLLIFIGMYTVGRHILKKPGQQILVYVMLSSLERFTTDFWRGDRTFFTALSISLSINQWIALFLIIISSIVFLRITYYTPHRVYERI